VGGEFCPSGLDVNIEFDHTKKMRGPENSPLGYARFFPFCADSAFVAIRADLLGKQPSRMQWQWPGARAGRFYSRQDLLSGGQPGKSQLQKAATL
jgi:hypothetical protein